MSSKSKFKIWKASKESEAGFMVTPDSAVMAGAKSSFIAATKEGVHISGPVSFITTGEQMRHGGLFVNMNEFTGMIPSTIVTPIPPYVPYPPVAMAMSLVAALPFLIAMYAL